MRTLAIDLGTRRIGLAMSDEGGRMATPYDVIQFSGAGQAIEPILKIISNEGVTRIVVGLPLNMDGTLGPAAKKTIAWAAELSKKTGKATIFVDERLSSFEAEQGLIERKRSGEKLTRKSKKRMLDALAAASFLQAFLDGKIAEIRVNDDARIHRD